MALPYCTCEVFPQSDCPWHGTATIKGWNGVPSQETERRAVAFRVKDFADGWILCHTFEQALKEADGDGRRVQPLYV